MRNIVLHDTYKGMEKSLPQGHRPTTFEVNSTNALLSDDAIETLKNSSRVFAPNIDECAGSGDAFGDQMSRFMSSMGVNTNSDAARSMTNALAEVMGAMDASRRSDQ